MLTSGTRLSSASRIADIVAMQAVIPVINPERVEDALTIARTLVEAGLPVMQVSLRSPAALQSLAALRGVRGAVAGASSAINAFDIEDAAAAGAKFAVASGLSGSLTGSATFANLPLLPSFATPSELLLGLEMGFSCFEFYPAETFGGPLALEELSARFSNVRFCPFGGITEDRTPAYLKLASVTGVGAAWITPPHLVSAGLWDEIGLIACRAARMR